MTAEPMTPEKRASRVIFENVSKFYGDVLGVNRVNLSIPPGITGLVGPNGSGKTTLMNMMVGLIRPSRGRISVLGMTPDQPEELFRKVGYASQYDAFPPGLTGRNFGKRVSSRLLFPIPPSKSSAAPHEPVRSGLIRNHHGLGRDRRLRAGPEDKRREGH